MTRVYVAPYHLRNSYSREIANGLNGLRIRPSGSRYVYRSGDFIINWGRSGHLPFPVAINQPEAVSKAVHKGRTWDTLHRRGVPTVTVHYDRERAVERLESGVQLYGRETLTGFGGRGVVYLPTLADLERAEREGHRFQAYTERFPVRREFRILVMRDKALLVSEKLRRSGTHPNEYVRSHGDWVFCRNNLAPYPDTLKEQAIAATQALGLDFAGVDIALDSCNNVCVLEVNTAPALVGRSVEVVLEAIKEIIAENECSRRA